MIFKNNSLDLAQNYDYFILDVWGVIHDGTSTYPNVLKQLQSLKEMGKKICFLSNAPRRAVKVEKVLENYGITKDIYDFIMTSGEASFLYLKKNQENNFNEFGKEYYYIGPKKDQDLLKGLQYKEVQNAKDATFAIAAGFENEFSTLEELIPQLENAAQANLPMLCINPDLIVIKHSGREMLCAGILAKEYIKMGGKVTYFGKPYKPVYDQVVKSFALDSQNLDKAIAIGDGIETDILGANNNNIDSALIGGGILSNRLKIKYGQLPEEDKLEEICQQYKIHPKFVISGL